jgi:hypothetical protein
MDQQSPEPSAEKWENAPEITPGPDPDPGFYSRALARIPSWMTLVTAIALPFIWWRGGALWAASFLTGVIGGYWNYVGVCRVADRLTHAVERGGRAPRFNFRSMLRLLFIAGAAFVIIRFTRINLVAAFMGLFTPVAAVVAEILYELFSRKS